MGLKILLLQARAPGDPMADHERRCFVARTGLPEEAVVPHDLCAGPPALARLRDHDAVTVGGSGDYYVSKGNLPQFEAFLEFLREIVDRGHPTFSSCFGYQSMVRALGGELIHDPDNGEVGTYELELSPEGKADPLFGSLPARFDAQLGHNDRAISIGDGTLNLAGSRLSPYQALRVPGKPVWATQFHPELERETNLARYKRYIDNYGPADERSRAEAFARFRESPHASSLLARFLEIVFG